MSGDSLFNPNLTDWAAANLAKMAFIPGADPSGGGGAPPPDAGGGGGGGMPPGMPGMMPPDGGGGGAPPPPGGGPGGPGGDDPFARVIARLDQLEQKLGGGMGMAGGGAGGPALKPKIDVNVEIMQVKNMLARLLDAMGVPVQATDFTATPEKLQQMAAQQGQDPAGLAGGGAPGGGAGSAGAIPPPSPMPGMQGAGVPGQAKAGHDIGTSFDTAGLDMLVSRTDAVLKARKQLA